MTDSFDDMGFAQEDYTDMLYLSFDKINFDETITALRTLLLFDDPNLGTQAINIGIVDKFITNLEYDLMHKLHGEERTPVDQAMFVSALTQMWIFALYELLRTWRERANKIITWHKYKILQQQLEHVEEDIFNLSASFYKRQLQTFIDNPNLIAILERDLARSEIIFYEVEAIRVRLAKHELPGKKNLFPRQEFRINHWCGSLDYQLEDGKKTTFGMINRRQIADKLRHLALNEDPQSLEEREQIKEWLRGPKDLPEF